jgi:hypothetical protein
LNTPQKVTLSDGHSLEATAEGKVMLETLLPNRNTKKGRLNSVLLVPKLSYSLTSVSKASSEILNEQKKVIAFIIRAGNLYHLEHCGKIQAANLRDKEGKEKL